MQTLIILFTSLWEFEKKKDFFQLAKIKGWIVLGSNYLLH